MNSTKVLLGRKIKELRKSKGWTQEKLSELLGINPKSILRIEGGKTFPTIQNLEKIAEIFQIDITDLFNNKNLDDIQNLKNSILEIIQTFNDNKIKELYNFVNAIK